MLDQDTARALLTIADQAHARVALVGDRHQLPAVGRGGVIDHAARWARPEACLALDTVHRFSDPEYATLSLLMRTGQDPGKVFDALHRRGQIAVHRSEVERLAAVAETAQDGGRIIADTSDQVTTLNAAIRDQRVATGQTASTGALITAAGEPLGLGDHIATRRNDRNLDVANRDTWTVIGIHDDGGLLVHGRSVERTLPAPYVRHHVELAYATTVHGAQGETVDHAHLLVGEATGAAAAYVGMTRGRRNNTAHLVAANIDDARDQWTAVFARDRADLGPADARERALQNIDRYGPRASPRQQLSDEQRIDQHREERLRPLPAPPAHGIGI